MRHFTGKFVGLNPLSLIIVTHTNILVELFGGSIKHLFAYQDTELLNDVIYYFRQMQNHNNVSCFQIYSLLLHSFDCRRDMFEVQIHN